MTEKLTTTSWRPNWTRRDHPLVRQYLRGPHTVRFGFLIVLSAVALFLMFGGLSLPMLYFLFSLIILLHIAVNTGDKIHLAREGSTWDLLRAMPFTQREVLLSLWAASFWQINRTWVMFFYRTLHGILVTGVIIFSLLFAEIPLAQWFLVLFTGTLVIAVQPFADMYYSGMVGLLSASLTHDRMTGQGLAVGGVLVYWLTWLILSGLVLWSSVGELELSHVMLLLTIPLILPLVGGYTTLQITERLP